MNRLALLKRINELRTEKGIASERALGVQAGVGPDFLRHIRTGKNKNPGADKLGRIAAVLETTVDDLLMAGRMSRPAPGPLQAAAITVIGEVQAGAWREAFEWPRAQQYALSLPPDARWPRARRFGLQLQGVSMNLLYPHPGTVLICARYDEIDEAPENGHIVIVERYRAGLVEATCKVFTMRPDGSYWLEPRSNDPSFKPFRLPKNVLDVPKGAVDNLPAIVHGGQFEEIPEDLEAVYVTARVTGVWAPQ